MPERIESITKSEMAYRAIRGMIVDGRLKAGQAVVQRIFAERLKTSNVPVIEALRRLEADGMVERRPHGRARVTKWNVRDHIQRLIVREVLEGAAARWCANRATEEQIRELRQQAQQVDSFWEIEKDGVSHPELDAKFHLLIAQHSGLDIVEKELNRFDLLDRTMRSGSQGPGRGDKQPPNGHGTLVDAIAARKPEQAELAMREHLREAREYLVGVARRRGLLGNNEYLDMERPMRGKEVD